ELHFSRAAIKLNIATPTLSAQIQALETMLGAKLFVRKTRSVALTDVGRRFLEEARATLRQAAQAELIGRRAARGELGSIAVAYVLSAACRGFVSSSIREFRAAHPDVSFQLTKMETFPQMKALIDGTLDVGFTRAPQRYPSGLTGFIVDRQPLWLAMPDDHRLSSRHVVEPAQNAEEPLPGRRLDMESGCWGDTAAITPAGATLRVVARMPDAFSVLTSVAAGVGLGVMSEALTAIQIPGLVFRRIMKTNRSSDHVLVYRKNEGATAIKAFVAMMRARSRGA